MKRKQEDQEDLGHASPEPIEQERAPPVVLVDYERYAHLLDDPDLSEAEKREFLQKLWEIICVFVSLGFGVHPVQQAQMTCGKLPKTAGESKDSARNGVKYDGQPIAENFVNAAGPGADAAAERVKP